MAEDSLLRDYDEALTSERKDRAVAVLGLPELIAGIQVEPLTCRRWEWLRATGNPLICGGECPIESVPHFIWIVSREFVICDDVKRDAFIAPILLHPSLPELREGIEAYLDRAFLDSPEGKAGTSYYSPSIGLYHTLNDYFPSAGWTLATVMDTPLRVLYQVIKCADKANGCVVVNRRSDLVKGRMLDKVESWEVETEAAIDPFIESKRAEGWGLFQEPIPRGARWMITMRRLTDGE